MGNFFGKSNEEQKRRENDSDGHPWLSSDRVALLGRIYTETFSFDGSEPGCGDDKQSGYGKRLCSALNFDDCHARAVELLFSQDSNDGKRSSVDSFSEACFVDTVGVLVFGSVSEVRKLMHRVARFRLDILFNLLFEASEGNGKYAPSSLVAGCESFCKKIDSVDKENVHGDNLFISEKAFTQWCSTNAPALHEPLRYAFGATLLNISEFCRNPFYSLQSKASVPGEILSPSDAFALACCDQRCQASWELLFSSSRNGMSFDALAHAIIGYGGPSILVVKDHENNVFAGLCSEQWRESSLFFGHPNSVLFSLQPRFAVMRCRGNASSTGGGNYQYLKVRGRQGFLGIGFGGDLQIGPRLFLDRNFEKCTATNFCLTYEEGELRISDNKFFGSTFRPAAIECWGLGGSEAKLIRDTNRVDDTRIRTNRRKVDRKKFLETSFDKEYLLGKTFEASTGSRGTNHS